MKLNKTEIEQLKKLISKRGFTYTDVQYEILDHVACAIEKLREESPELSLESAFTKVHASFGIFGFSGLEESYSKKLQKIFINRWLKSIEYYVFGKGFWLNLLLIAIVYVLFSLGMPPLASLLVFFAAVSLFIFIELIRIERQKELRNFLSFRIAGSITGGLGVLPTLPYHLANIGESITHPFWSSFLLFGSIYFVLLIVLAMRKAHLEQVEETKSLMALYELD